MIKLFNWIAAILVALSIYNCIIAAILDWRLSKRDVKTDANTAKPAGKKLSAILQLISILILIFLMFWALVSYPSLVIFIVVPGVLLYAFSVFSASKTVGALTMSKGDNQLTEDENNSLNFIGFLLALVSTYLATWMRNIQANNASLAETLFLYFIIVIVFSIYLFVIGTLSVRPLKDLSKIILFVASKIHDKYAKLMCSLANKIDFTHIKDARAETVLEQIKTSTGWKIAPYIVSFVFISVLDISTYIIQYMMILIFWLPVAIILLLIRSIGSLWVRMAQTLCQIPKRRVAVVSFRIAVIIAILAVVVLNRIYPPTHFAETTTSILEFFASVILIPIAFEWIHETLTGNNYT